MVLPTVDDDGNVRVSVDDAEGDSVPALLTRLIWEFQELRRAYCDATDQLFKEYPEDGEG